MEKETESMYIDTYKSPIGNIELIFSKRQLIHACFGILDERDFFLNKIEVETVHDGFVATVTKEWLDIYFSGGVPDFTPPLCFHGTPFQKAVWRYLLTIPYGQTVTYGEIAKKIAADRGIPRMAAQAVGNAVGANPTAIIVPCHRVIGTNGNLTGYAGGLDKKVSLLTLEKVDMGKLYIPRK